MSERPSILLTTSYMNDDPVDSNLHRLAIAAALSFNWNEAVELNKQILKLQPENTDSLNRLARAFFELGKYPQAKKMYQSVLKIDPYNAIAQKNLKKLSAFKKISEVDGTSLHSQANYTTVSPSLFLEEAGVTKVVNLIKLTEPQKLSRLSPGLMVNLVLKNRGISVTDQNDVYLGGLPDDMSFLLMRMMKGGNKYQTLVKSVRQNGLSILVRETFRSKKFKNQPSFIADSKSLNYVSDNITFATNDDETPVETPESDDSYTI